MYLFKHTTNAHAGQGISKRNSVDFKITNETRQEEDGYKQAEGRELEAENPTETRVLKHLT